MNQNKIRAEIDMMKTEEMSMGDKVEIVASKLEITNGDVIKALDLEDYVQFLIDDRVIPNILTDNFVEEKYSSEYLNSIGDDY